MAIDRLTDIELQMKNVLLEIQSTTTTPNGYTYFNDVTVVNMEDESLMLAYGDYPSINIYLDPEETVLSGEQNAYRSIAKYRLVGRVAVDDLTPQPRFAINEKMNTLLSDIKAVLSENFTLNCTCDRADIKRSLRIYNDDTGHNLRVGQLVVGVEVLYSQSRLNPILNACV
jgi:hypothetical protein